MNAKRLLTITVLLNTGQTNAFVGPARAAAQRLVAAARAKMQNKAISTVRIAVQPDNQKRAMGTIAGGVAGYYTTNENDSFGQKIVKTGIGATAGFAAAGTSQIGVIHSRVTDLYKTGARKVDIQNVKDGLAKTEVALAKRIGEAESSLKQHTMATAEELKSAVCKDMAHEINGVKVALNETERRLASQMRNGFENNKSLHAKAYEMLIGKK